MNPSDSSLRALLLLSVASFLTSCASTGSKPIQDAAAGQAVTDKKNQATKHTASATDEHDDYAESDAHIADPLEPINRGMFWCNDKLYTFIFRPISKTYEFVFPKPVRKGIDNAFENVKYPVRVVNCALQGKFKRAGQETGKFLVNTVGGVGGIFQPAEKIPALAHVPAEDTAQTFATWGIGHGPYIVLPLLGPSSLRDTVGLACDYAGNPVNWPMLYWHGGGDWEHDWTMALPSSNTLRSMPDQFSKYDAATKDAIDPYLSARSAYVQNRAEEAKK